MLVHFWETKDTSTGARAPIVGRLRFRATRSRVIAGTPDEEVLPEPFSVRLDDDGKASVPLAATSGSWAWEVSLYGDAGWGPFYVAVGAGAEADWPDLVRVDPATLAPAQPAVPAWEAAVDAVEGYAQAAADSAALAAGSAEHVGETIAAEVQDHLTANPPPAGDDGREVEFGLSATHVQWRYVGDVAWIDLIDLSSLVGATGAAPELQATATHLQWRAPGGTWADLVTLESLRGPQGDPGSSAYEVAVAGGYSGSEAAWLASLKGEQGDAAPLPVITATATTGAPGSSAAASVSGTYPDLSLDLTIPDGEQGDPGPANSLAIGTVTTGAAGSSASASITGTAPSQTLNLTIPRGNVGDPTAYELRGTGMPNGVVTASPGTYYTDTAGTNGAWRWLKKSGTGNTGWWCISGDTGWRNISSLIEADFVPIAAGVKVRRISETAYLDFEVAPAASLYGAQTGVWKDFWRYPPSSFSWPLPLIVDEISDYTVWLNTTIRLQMRVGYNWISIYGVFPSTTFSSSTRFRGRNSWRTDNAWPTVLPGTPA